MECKRAGLWESLRAQFGHGSHEMSGQHSNGDMK